MAEKLISQQEQVQEASSEAEILQQTQVSKKEEIELGTEVSINQETEEALSELTAEQKTQVEEIYNKVLEDPDKYPNIVNMYQKWLGGIGINYNTDIFGASPKKNIFKYFMAHASASFGTMMVEPNIATNPNTGEATTPMSLLDVTLKYGGDFDIAKGLGSFGFKIGLGRQIQNPFDDKNIGMPNSGGKGFSNNTIELGTNGKYTLRNSKTGNARVSIGGTFDAVSSDNSVSSYTSQKGFKRELLFKTGPEIGVTFNAGQGTGLDINIGLKGYIDNQTDPKYQSDMVGDHILTFSIGYGGFNKSNRKSHIQNIFK